MATKSAEEIELDLKINALADARYGSHDVATLKNLFMSYDSDGDGLLSASEVERLYKDADVGNWLTRSTWVSETFKKVDKSGDGKLSWEEYLAASSIASSKPASLVTPSTSDSTPVTPETPESTEEPETSDGKSSSSGLWCDDDGRCYVGIKPSSGMTVICDDDGYCEPARTKSSSAPLLALMVGGVAAAIFAGTLRMKTNR